MEEKIQVEREESIKGEEKQEETETKEQIDKRLSYNELKKMEKQFANSFPDLSPNGVLQTLKHTMPETFGDVKTNEQAMDILKNGKDEQLQQGKNEMLYQRLNDHMKKEEKIQELQEQLIEHKPEVNEGKPNKQEVAEPQIENKEQQKSESKLWKKTKEIINRPLDHTRLGKYLIKKPINRITKKKPAITEK